MGGPGQPLDLRELTLAERARRFERAAAGEGLPDERLLHDILPALGVRPTPEHLRLYKAFTAEPASFRAAAEAVRLPFEAWRFVARYPAADRAAFLDALAVAPLSHSNQVRLAEWLLDLTGDGGPTVAELLAELPPRPGAGKAWLEAIRRRRFPTAGGAAPEPPREGLKNPPDLPVLIEHRDFQGSMTLEQGLGRSPNLQPFDILFVDRAVADHPRTAEILGRLPGIPVQEVEGAAGAAARIPPLEADPVGAGKRRLLLTRHAGDFLKPCPCTPRHVGCGYHFLHLAAGCPFDCAYCILQAYLNAPFVRVAVNLENAFDELDRRFAAEPGRRFRVGTGELTDSLALDPWLRFAEPLAGRFARYGNAVLELKTKGCGFAHLAALDPATRVILSWSLNAAAVAEREEKGCPPVADRLAEAAAFAARGFRVGFHFDPVVLGEVPLEAYGAVIDGIYDRIPADRVAWISLGALRFAPEVKPVLRERHPGSRLPRGELARGEDGKFRYPEGLRCEAFAVLAARIRRRDPGAPVYLCMEGAAVWEHVFGPGAASRLHKMLDERVFGRYSGPGGVP